MNNGKEQELIACREVLLGDVLYYYRGADYATGALEHYRKAADLGYHWGCFNVGMCYLEGRGVPKDDPEARSWFRKAEEAGGNPWAAEKLADMGDVEAAQRVGEYYASGSRLADWGMPQDSSRAEKFRRQVEDYAWGKVKEGDDFYYNKKNYPEALECYREAAHFGHHWGFYNVGKMYQLEKGVKGDKTEALVWLLKAKEKNHPDSMEKILHRLAELGDPASMSEYADKLSARGAHGEAYKWYYKAADAGYHWGCYNVAECYRHGRGVTADPSEARKWYLKAIRMGDNSAAKNCLSEK